jgi:hypothetical protein
MSRLDLHVRALLMLMITSEIRGSLRPFIKLAISLAFSGAFHPLVCLAMPCLSQFTRGVAEEKASTLFLTDNIVR